MFAIYLVMVLIGTNVDSFTDRAQLCADNKLESKECKGPLIEKEISYRVKNEKR